MSRFMMVNDGIMDTMTDRMKHNDFGRRCNVEINLYGSLEGKIAHVSHQIKIVMQRNNVFWKSDFIPVGGQVVAPQKSVGIPWREDENDESAQQSDERCCQGLYL
jgi:hypothetical protein